MAQNDSQKKLKQSLESNISRLEKSKKEKKSILAQTVFLGTLGVMFILPVVLGAYLGVWLDKKLSGFSFSWTVSLIFLGVVVGAVNVYLFIKD